MGFTQTIDLKNTSAYLEVLKAYKELCKKVNSLDSCESKPISFIFSQGVASSTWTIVHNLNFFPNVTIVDSAGDEVIGDIHYSNINTIIVHFSGAFSGKAYLS